MTIWLSFYLTYYTIKPHQLNNEFVKERCVGWLSFNVHALNIYQVKYIKGHAQ